MTDEYVLPDTAEERERRHRLARKNIELLKAQAASLQPPKQHDYRAQPLVVRMISLTPPPEPLLPK